MKNILISILITGLLVGCANTQPSEHYAENEYSYTKEGLPADVKTAVFEILKDMDTESKELVRSAAKDDLIRFHHGWGTGIRNSFGLWGGNKELLESACGKGCHPDDASMVIIEAVWSKLNEKP